MAPHRLAPLSEGRIASDGLFKCLITVRLFSGSERLYQHIHCKQIEGRGGIKRLASLL